ncbi:MAG: hypothetical protein PHP35_00535 [Candidatus Colwellbacteria bacterium]|nr:hypothetical protein [Candidatus Colwellbacteria bacterium]
MSKQPQDRLIPRVFNSGADLAEVAEGVANVANGYYPMKADRRDVIELSQTGCAAFITLYDQNRLIGFATIVAVNQEGYKRFVQGTTFGIGRRPYPSDALPYHDGSLGLYFILDMMIASKYRNSLAWLHLMSEAATLLRKIAKNDDAVIAALSDPKTGCQQYKLCLGMIPSKKFPFGDVCETTIGKFFGAVSDVEDPLLVDLG